MQFTWYKEWENLQKLGETEYRLYLANCREKSLEFEFLQIDMDGFARFKFGWRVMIIHKHSFENWLEKNPKIGFKITQSEAKTKYINSKPNLNFAISLCSDPFFGHANHLLCNQNNFIKYCQEFGVSRTEIDEFFNMKEPNWENL